VISTCNTVNSQVVKVGPFGTLLAKEVISTQRTATAAEDKAHGDTITNYITGTYVDCRLLLLTMAGHMKLLGIEFLQS